jgi:antiphage defense system Thoeris ThsB-like protein
MRHVYFAFHYKSDIWRVNQVRNSGLLFGAQSVGFADRSLWENAKTKGSGALEKLILDGLDGTSATVVLIGEETADRRWVQFEIQESYDRNNALIGVRIHHLADQRGYASRKGRIPDLLTEIRAPVYDWDASAHDLGEWVEQAVRDQCE